MPFFLSKDFDNIPSMSWKKIWESVFLRFARSINSLSRHNILKDSVNRKMIGPNVIVNINGMREEDIYSWFELNGTGEPNVWNFRLSNIKVEDSANGPSFTGFNAPISSIAVSYIMEFNPASGMGGAEETRIWMCRPHIDGIHYASGDSVMNYKWNDYTANGAQPISCSGFFMAEVLSGEHLLNIVVDLPWKTQLMSAEVSITRFNW
jgi:hypothetical protein